MSKAIKNKEEITRVYPRVTSISPYPTRFILEHLSLQEELRQVKQRLSELENIVAAKDKVIVLKDITREVAKKEIKKLFSSGRTLYYSDIVQELGIDLETVVDICNELEEEKEIAIDARIPK
jgi:DNA invertase Pin-like site-specific DNA recombinase